MTTSCTCISHECVCTTSERANLIAQCNRTSRYTRDFNRRHAACKIAQCNRGLTSPLHSTDISNDIIMSSQCTLQTFSSDYNGPVMILVECIDLNKNLGNWHPIKAAKFFSTNFNGITNIKPAGSKKIKINFDSISNGNLCLTSDVLNDHGFIASIPSNLIYSFGIIKLDPDVSEDDFRDGAQSLFPIVSFKRISIKKDGNIVPTRIVELKFLSAKLPQHISVYNMIFDVNPSIRSPVQCNRCLRTDTLKNFVVAIQDAVIVIDPNILSTNARP